VPQIVRFRGAGGSEMLVEIDRPAIVDEDLDVGLVVERRSGPVADVTTRLEDSLASVEGASVALMSTVDELRKRDGGLRLSQVALELSLSFGVEGGVVVAKGTASAEATVTLTWCSGEQT
jgi:hypothetical protein